MTITRRNLDDYGTPPIDWARVTEVLDTQLTHASGSGGPAAAHGVAHDDQSGRQPARDGGRGADGGLQRPVGRPGAVDVYRVEPSTVFALGASEPFGATEFRLG